MSLLQNLFIAGIALAPFLTQPASAGILFYGETRWSNFVFEPKASEPTPNYYGYGFGLHLGYSIMQNVDIATFGIYTPGRLKEPKFGETDAVSTLYGGEIAARIVDSVYIGLRGGGTTYALNTKYSSDEVPGVWKGYGGELGLGAIIEVTRSHFWQVGVNLMHGVVACRQECDETGENRAIDGFSVSVGYGLNKKESSGGIFGGNLGDLIGL